MPFFIKGLRTNRRNNMRQIDYQTDRQIIRQSKIHTDSRTEVPDRHPYKQTNSDKKDVEKQTKLTLIMSWNLNFGQKIQKNVLCSIWLKQSTFKLNTLQAPDILAICEFRQINADVNSR